MKPHRVFADLSDKFDSLSLKSVASPSHKFDLGQSPWSQASGGGSSISLYRETATGGEKLKSSERKEQQELARMRSVGKKKDFRHMQRVGRSVINVLQGLELHTNVFDAEEQKNIVDCIYDLQEKGRRGHLRDRTYTEPSKWMRGKGRVTIQFGCCYNYAVDKHGNPPGINRDEEVDPLPPLLKWMIKRMVSWRVLPPSCIPNSCIVNIYDKDDCIPPHIDHHDFARPFCTVSFLSECRIVFGTELKVVGPGEFSGSATIPLPLGSVLILSGNGADVAKHCVPAVPAKRISITFRRMDDSKLPFKFKTDPELENFRPPLQYPIDSRSSAAERITYAPPAKIQQNRASEATQRKQVPGVAARDLKSPIPFQLGEDDFPPLGSAAKSRR